MYKIEFSDEENGYIMTCGESGLKEFITEDEFCEMVESGKLVDTSEDVDFDECDCPYCEGVRDGIQLGLDMAVEVVENLDDDEMCQCDTCRPIDLDEEIHNDIQDSLLALKETMDQLLEDGCYIDYRELTDCYERLFKLIY